MKVKPFFWILLIAIVGGTAFWVGQNQGYTKGEEVGNKVGIIKGKEEGHKIGEKVGHEKGIEEGKQQGIEYARTVMEQALRGASELLIDQDFNTIVPYQKAVDVLDQSNSINAINNISSDVNKSILVSVIEFSDFNDKDKSEILNRFNEKKELINHRILSKYERNLEIEQKNQRERHLTIVKTEVYTDAIASNMCELISVLSPLQKQKLALTLIGRGTQQLSMGAGLKVTAALTEKAIDAVANNICQIVLENSFEFLTKAFHEYANIKAFSQQIVVAGHQRQMVHKLTTVEDNVSVEVRKSFERSWVYDANYIAQFDAKVSAGIDINKGYKVEFIRKELSSNNQTKVIVTVPEPEILSTDISMSTQSHNEFFSTKLSAAEITTLFNLGKEKANQEAYNNNIIAEAKNNTQQAFENIYYPLLFNAQADYTIEVRFGNVSHDVALLN